MNAQEFEKVIQGIDARFTVAENPNRPGLSNIFFQGKNYDLPVISTSLIKETIDHGHRYKFPNGMYARIWCQSEITDRLKKFLVEFNAGDYEE